MFELSNVRYKEILDIDNLVLPDKKVVCIVGESGSGKTTLLRLLNNLITCDTGTITWNGKGIYDYNSIELRRQVVMLGQNPVVFDGTIRDNLLIGLSFSEKPPVDDDKLISILNAVRLKKELSDVASQLSGGEKQRLALARVLLLEPEVLLLDEPSSALDDETERILIERLVSYAKDKGKSLIMVTHSRNVAENFGEYIVEIKNGRLVSVKGVKNSD